MKMMNSIALHLIVFFIIGTQFNEFNSNFYSSFVTAGVAQRSTVKLVIDEAGTAHELQDNNNGTENKQKIFPSNDDFVGGQKPKYLELNRRNRQEPQTTTKKIRTLRRLIGGHINHSNASVQRSQFKRKINQQNYDNTRVFVLEKNDNLTETTTSSSSSSSSASQVVKDASPQITNIVRDTEIDDDDDDEAYLEKSDLSDGILRLSAGAGKEDQSTKSKLLAQQVAEGKYGLIENELFTTQPKRPGVVSYVKNEDFPNDNEKNYGGLDEDDIWLAEDHLLVIKGGKLNEKDDNKNNHNFGDDEWPAIDNYEANGRPIKIPINPKVPPPFPVQLEENGPIQFIGNNKFTFIDPLINESLSIYTAGNEDHSSSKTNYNDQTNLLTGPREIENVTAKNLGYFYQQAKVLSGSTASLDDQNKTGNQTNNNDDDDGDYFDDDDPSVYYPPPYSFVYKSNYTNPVPPGPLVPGIVLPPPPDSFSPLEPEITKIKPSNKEVPFKEILKIISNYEPVSETPTKVRKPSGNKRRKLKNQSTTAKPSYNIAKELSTSTHPTAPQPEVFSLVDAFNGSNTLSKDNPIYYEYYETTGKTQIPTDATANAGYYTSVPTPPNPTIPSVPSTARPPQHPNALRRKQQKLKSTTNQPPTIPKPYANKKYLAAQKYFDYDDVVYITPKPESRSKKVVTNNDFIPLVLTSNYNQNLKHFDNEINSIRDTIQFYSLDQSKNKNSNNNNARAPKTNPNTIYEYSFDATKTKPTTSPKFDTEPFKPMVKYSLPADDANGFKAMTVKINDNPRKPTYYRQPIEAKAHYQLPSDRIRVNIIYDPENDARRNEVNNNNGQNQLTTPSTILSIQKPWVTIEKQVLQEYDKKNEVTTAQYQEKFQKRRPLSSRTFDPNSPKFNGYYYGQAGNNNPPRVNNRFYDEPFSNQLFGIRNKINEYNNVPQPPRYQNWNLENDTYVNYVQPRPAINTNSEYIAENYPRGRIRANIQQFPPQPSVFNRQQKIWSLENDTNVNYIPENRPPINPHAEYIKQHRQKTQQQFNQPYRQQLQQQQQQQQRPWSLENDTYVNYVQSRPINPNAEFIPVRSQQQQQQLYYPQFQQRPQQIIQNQAQRLPTNFGNNNNGAVYPGHSLHSDINVNYRPPFPTPNPNSEFINIQPQRPQNNFRFPAPQPFQPQFQQQQQQQQQQQNYYEPNPFSSNNYLNNNRQRIPK